MGRGRDFGGYKMISTHVIYSLYDDGKQPYLTIENTNTAGFTGGIANYQERYLGIVFGDTQEIVNDAIAACTMFDMVVVNQQDVEDFRWVADGSPPKFILQPERQLIIANGLHVAKVIVSTLYLAPCPVADTLLINDVEQTVNLVNGTATIEITSTTPGTVFALEYHGLYAVVEAK